MMTAPTGSMPKVTGRRMAIVLSEPSPGMTPTMVPSRTPMKSHPRFWSVNTIPKPSRRLDQTGTSTGSLSCDGVQPRSPLMERGAATVRLLLFGHSEPGQDVGDDRLLLVERFVHALDLERVVPVVLVNRLLPGWRLDHLRQHVGPIRLGIVGESWRREGVPQICPVEIDPGLLQG